MHSAYFVNAGCGYETGWEDDSVCKLDGQRRAHYCMHHCMHIYLSYISSRVMRATLHRLAGDKLVL